MLLKALRVLLTISGLVLIIDCVLLIAVGKINFSTVVPLLLGLIFIAHGIFWQPIRDFVSQSPWLSISWYALWGLFGLWLVSFGIFIGSLQQQIKLSKQLSPSVAAVIVLGSGTVNGQPTPTLAARLDRAVPVIKSQPQAVVITSGGVGFGRSRSEADVMATYLHEKHDIPLERVIQEGESTSTEENLINSQAILKAQGVTLSDPIAIVTSDFHTIRSAAIARHQGYQQPVLLASPTPLSIRYNAWFREYFAFVSGWLLREY